jgi:hypothetical protein
MNDQNNETDAVPFRSANRKFYDHVCAFLEENGYCVVPFATWLDIRGMAFNLSRIHAIKLLRNQAFYTEKKTVILPEDFTRLPNRAFVQYTFKYCATEIVTRRLSLSDAKCIIDLLIYNEDAFGK